VQIRASRHQVAFTYLIVGSIQSEKHQAFLAVLENDRIRSAIFADPTSANRLRRSANETPLVLRTCHLVHLHDDAIPKSCEGPHPSHVHQLLDWNPDHQFSSGREQIEA
jgi:hypothetical protein